MLREIVLDTETTGLDPLRGDRLIEVGCVELVNRIPTGREFHRYVNPERDVPREAEAVHGLSTAFLLDKPVFAAVADELLAFISEDVLVIHNASFDVGFLNAELARAGPRADRDGPRRRHAGARPPPASRRPQQPRRPVQALRRRQLEPREARRAAGLASVGVRLRRAAGWASFARPRQLRRRPAAVSLAGLAGALPSPPEAASAAAVGRSRGGAPRLCRHPRAQAAVAAAVPRCGRVTSLTRSRSWPRRPPAGGA